MLDAILGKRMKLIINRRVPPILPGSHFNENLYDWLVEQFQKTKPAPTTDIRAMCAAVPMTNLFNKEHCLVEYKVPVVFEPLLTEYISSDSMYCLLFGKEKMNHSFVYIWMFYDPRVRDNRIKVIVHNPSWATITIHKELEVFVGED